MATPAAAAAAAASCLLPCPACASCDSLTHSFMKTQE
jgi:hypothetical protein